MKSTLFIIFSSLNISTAFAVPLKFIDEDIEAVGVKFPQQENHVTEQLKIENIDPENSMFSVLLAQILKKNEVNYLSANNNDKRSFIKNMLSLFKKKEESTETTETANECYTKLQENVVIYEKPDLATYYYVEDNPGTLRAEKFPTDVKKLNSLFNSPITIVGFKKSKTDGSLGLIPLTVKLEKEKFDFYIFHGKQLFSYRKTQRGHLPVLIGFGVSAMGSGQSNAKSLSLSGINGVVDLSAAISNTSVKGDAKVINKGLTLPPSISKLLPMPDNISSTNFNEKMKEIYKFVDAVDVSSRLPQDSDALVLTPYYLAIGEREMPESCFIFNDGFK
ncbi:hypothetical protein [Acinetobacter sp. ANC 3832]|uniref:hypothetical protein n=1 Tax=Acinetobacter sp. ANC 3832 TaxID=1977874 RepID=UPI000A34F503|nr:hypothetical protein [Acinetobacter sp. ANC 3832]OTG87227.1 hypothetical protein B9T35_17890 [Acinetobacter sp. ANC 3832]